MAKYRIAWMPGDGVGNDVMEAARIVLDRLKLDAEYVPCDIGWEFWCKEGNALPDRTVEALKETTCALFGAITSKPQDKAKEELIPELQGKGLVYFSPIVGLRQLFNLHTNMRPCKSYLGNPLNYRGNKITNPGGEDVAIDQVVFRENTEGMYGGVEFFPWPEIIRRFGRMTRTSTPFACGCSRIRRITPCSWRKTCSATSSAICPRASLVDSGSRPAPTSVTTTLYSSRRTDRRRNTPVNTRSIRSRCS